MPADTPGIHHVTAVGTDPQRTHDFYAGTLGLRLVKRSVNQDDVSVYHLFYADQEGSPGTSMTLFSYTDARSGRPGVGQVTSVAFLVPDGSLEFWADRLADAGVDIEGPIERFGEDVLQFTDPDGLPLELVASTDVPAGEPPAGPVPDDHAIRGFFGVTLTLTGTGPTADLLEEMGYREVESDQSRHRFVSDGELGYVVDLREDPQGTRAVPGAGTVHHVAYRVSADEQDDWRQLLTDRGLRPTEIIDRKWFRSVYVREHGGVLFEFATDGPGYAVDEAADSLGEQLVLPEWLEGRREEIEAGLPPLETD